MPLPETPKSSSACLQQSTEVGPPVFMYGPDMSFSTPILIVGAPCARGAHERQRGGRGCGAEQSAAGDGHGISPSSADVIAGSVSWLASAAIAAVAAAYQTPRYSCSLSMLASSWWFGIMSITWPCSIT